MSHVLVWSWPAQYVCEHFIFFFKYTDIRYCMSFAVGHYSAALKKIIEMYDSDSHSKLTGMPQLKQQGMKLPTLSYPGG